jgi:hypothetical protein
MYGNRSLRKGPRYAISAGDPPLYGVKGMAAYANHARRLGKSDESVSAFIEEALFATVTNVNFDMDSLLELVLECGAKNVRVMELLDQGHLERAVGMSKPGVVSFPRLARPHRFPLATQSASLEHASARAAMEKAS